MTVQGWLPDINCYWYISHEITLPDTSVDINAGGKKAPSKSWKASSSQLRKRTAFPLVTAMATARCVQMWWTHTIYICDQHHESTLQTSLVLFVHDGDVRLVERSVPVLWITICFQTGQPTWHPACFSYITFMELCDSSREPLPVVQVAVWFNEVAPSCRAYNLLFAIYTHDQPAEVVWKPASDLSSNM